MWGVHEVTLSGPKDGNPFIDVELSARFRCDEHIIATQGFYDGEGTYRVRLMPEIEGTWQFETSSNVASLDGVSGSFDLSSAASESHGPVRVADTYHFAHADGTPYRPFGTTCYAWTHQSDELEQQTLQTLEESPFNKMRMCVFPKSYLYNQNEPSRQAFERLPNGEFDLARFNPDFFRHLEQRISDLGRLGIEADLILFHPYDRWGYDELPRDVDDHYVRYVVARLAAFANVWWSLANEYDFMWAKELEDWERIGSLVKEQDPHGHLISIHQAHEFYDHNKSWVMHCSLQRVDAYRTAEDTSEWRDRWHKPVVIDECAYEGDIEMTWGNISAQEMTRRFWEGTVRGGYVGHGETYMTPGEILWWSKGGELRGGSPPRIAFLRSIVEEGPDKLEPLPQMSRMGYQTAGVAGEYYLQYQGLFQPGFRIFDVSSEDAYQVDVIDTWNMTIDARGVMRGSFQIDLPARPFMAVRLVRVHGGRRASSAVPPRVPRPHARARPRQKR